MCEHMQVNSDPATVHNQHRNPPHSQGASLEVTITEEARKNLIMIRKIHCKRKDKRIEERVK